MPSNRLTKMNVDVDQKELVKTLAAGKGLSDTKMLEVIILFYITHGGVPPRPTAPVKLNVQPTVDQPA